MTINEVLKTLYALVSSGMEKVQMVAETGEHVTAYQVGPIIRIDIKKGEQSK